MNRGRVSILRKRGYQYNYTNISTLEHWTDTIQLSVSRCVLSNSSVYAKAPRQTVLKIRSGAPGQLETVTSAVNVTSTCTETEIGF